MTVAELQAHLDRLDDGILRHGSHKPGREFCALEFKSQVDGGDWTDSPPILDFPDIRPLNDAPWATDKARTDALLPVMAALWDWPTWSSARRQRWAEIISIRTVNTIISALPGLSDDIRQRCKDANTLNTAAYAAAKAAKAAKAADAAAYAADAAAYAADAAYAAAKAAKAAEAAAYAADAAVVAKAAKASIVVLTQSCQIFIDAANETEGV